MCLAQVDPGRFELSNRITRGILGRKEIPPATRSQRVHGWKCVCDTIAAAGGNPMTIRPRYLRGRSMLATSVAAVLATPLAYGQNDDMGAGILEEIVVTARKVEESLLDVPISITAVTAAQIEASGIDDVADLALQTPGFSYRQGFGRTGSGQGEATSRPSIRGMSSILGAANAAFFVDGVYVSGNVSSYQLDNLQRVEVIRGPQSALFGRQTFAGAINFVTREPGD